MNLVQAKCLGDLYNLMSDFPLKNHNFGLNQWAAGGITEEIIKQIALKWGGLYVVSGNYRSTWSMLDG